MTATRILVYGVTGTGKTTLARKISEKTGIPWHAVDDLTWNPGWQPVSEAEQRERVGEICSGIRWILDSAYGTWITIPLEAADLIVALDFPRWISLNRLVLRTAMRIIDKQTVCNGNIETLRTAFSRESILIWHFKSFSRKRMRMRAWAAKKDGPKVLHFTHPRQVQSWLDQLHETIVWAESSF